MEPLIDSTVLDLLVGDPAGRSWIVLVGAALVALVSVVRFVTEDRFSATAGRWISAIGGVVAAVGISYMTGVGSWVDGILIGLLATPATRGLLMAIRDMLPRVEDR